MYRRVGFFFAFSVLLMSMFGVKVGVYKVRASGTICIRADGTIDPPTANITRSGNLYCFTDHNYDAILVQRSNIVIDGDGYFLQRNASYGITISYVSNVTVHDLNIIDFQSGIQVLNASKCCIVGNNITSAGGSPGSHYGVSFKDSSRNIIMGNRIGGYGVSGILLSYSSYNEVSENIINSTISGSIIWRSPHNKVVTNTVRNMRTVGIGVVESFNTTIAENNLTDIGSFGVSIESSSNCSVYRNTVIGSDYGINILKTSNSVFYQNNLANSVKQVNIMRPGYPNHWDNGFDGNYYSDYVGVDSDSDGIGDTPYVIDADNIDNYPLMNLYWDPADINHDLKVDIYDLVLISGAYYSTPSDPEWNPHCDLMEPYGFINIYDVVRISGHYGKEYEP